MKRLGVKTYPLLMIGFVLSASLLLGACAQKAKMIRAGAAQFEAESLVAIDKIDELRRKEVEATPLPREEASDFFVNLVLQTTGRIDLKTLNLFLDPLKSKAPESEKEWQAFLQKMREQYTSLTATFSSLEKGSLFAVRDVKKVIPFVDKLIAQMAAFAKSIKDKPAEFLRDRSGIVAEIRHARDSQISLEEKKLNLLRIEGRLREIAVAEEKITRETMEQALKAATIGKELRKLLMDYDKLSLNDISEALSRAFKLVADIPGLDLSGVKTKTDDMITYIKTDESLNLLFETAFDGIHKARAK